MSGDGRRHDSSRHDGGHRRSIDRSRSPSGGRRRDRSRDRSRSPGRRGRDDWRGGPRRSRSRSRSREDRRRRRSRSGSPRRRRSPSPYRRRGSRSRSPGRGSRPHRSSGGGRSRSPPARRRHSRSRSPPLAQAQWRGGGGPLGGEHGGAGYFGGDRGPPRGPPGGGAGGSEEPPEVGSIHHATVVSVRPFGAFVELPGFRKQGLVHHTQISDEIRFGREDDDETKVRALEFFLPRGEKVWVKVVEVRREEGRGDVRVGCSMRAVDQQSGADLDPDNTLAGPRGGGGGGPRGPESEEPPELNSVHAATVQSLRPFGAFVKMEGFRKYGLVHVSQISDHLDLSREDTDEEKTAAIGAVLAIGEKVFVKVVDVKFDERGPKVGCSIKLVSQKDGTDLDPHNLKYRPRPEGGGPHARENIGAHVAEAHDGAVEWGHLKADVVQYGDQSKQYEILGDDSPPLRGGGRAALPAQAPPPLGFAPRAPGAPQQGGPLSPRGRGRGSILPAWMTGGAPGAPGSSGGGGGGEGRPSGGEAGVGGQITSVEDALKILEQFGKGKKDRKKEKKAKHKKEKKSKHKKEKKAKHKKERRRGSSSDSGSDSD